MAKNKKDLEMNGTCDDDPVEQRKRLVALGNFCMLFEEKGVQFGSWHGGDILHEGSIQIPYYELSELARTLLKHCYDHGWVLQGFDWPEWKRSDEAINLRDKQEVLSAASPVQLAKLLTVIIRQDRFSDGAFEEAYNTGLLINILRRSRELATK